jgi:hypothetical protein
MTSALKSPAVVTVLDRLHAKAEAEDDAANERVRAREAQTGARLTQGERYEVYGGAPQAIMPEVGELLYVLAVRSKAHRMIEFGSSLGVSTVYLAAAAWGLGDGSLLTSERHVGKATLARQNLADAGLRDCASFGLATLWTRSCIYRSQSICCSSTVATTSICRSSNWSSPHLSPGALVVADLSAQDPDLIPFLEHVRDPRKRVYLDLRAAR